MKFTYWQRRAKTLAAKCRRLEVENRTLKEKLSKWGRPSNEKRRAQALAGRMNQLWPEPGPVD